MAVAVDADPDGQYSGVIAFISREAEFTPSNVQTYDERSQQVYRVKVVLEGNIERLRPGMTVDVSLVPLGETP